MKSTMLTMNRIRRYRAEWEGEWKWATIARTKLIRVIKAATGCTIKILERVERVALGMSKSELIASVKAAVRIST